MASDWSESVDGDGTARARATALPLVLAPTTDPAWRLEEDGFNLAREHEIESLFTVSNGYVGTRASLEEGSPLTAPATFLAGIFDRGSTPETRAVLVAAPNWLGLRTTVEGQRLQLDHGVNLLHRRVLDMRQGLLWREWRHQDANGRITRVRTMRLVSRADRHALFQLVELTAENYSGRAEIEHWVEAPVASPASPATAPGLVPVPLPSELPANGTHAVALQPSAARPTSARRSRGTPSAAGRRSGSTRPRRCSSRRSTPRVTPATSWPRAPRRG